MENWYLDAENLINNKWLNVIQKDYDFFLIESKTDIKTVDELQKIAFVTDCKIQHKEIFSNKLKDYRLKSLRPLELTFSGYNYFLSKKLGNKILDFDYKNYLSNKVMFMKNNPNLDCQIEDLFNQNLKLIADFFLTDVEKIKQGKLDIRLGMQKRLMFNINNK